MTNACAICGTALRACKEPGCGLSGLALERGTLPGCGSFAGARAREPPLHARTRRRGRFRARFAPRNASFGGSEHGGRAMDPPSVHAAAVGGAADDYRGLAVALAGRGYCCTDRRTYDPIAPRSATLSGRFSLPAHWLASEGDVSAAASPGEARRARSRNPSLASPGSSQALSDVDAADDVSAAGSDGAAVTEISLGGSLKRRTDRGVAGTLLGPVPVPVQEDLCRFWIERRTGIELDEERPLADALLSGMLLCRLIDVEPPARPPRVIKPADISERNIAKFRREVKTLLSDPADVFEPQDLVYARNIPRVLRTIAAIAQATDPEGFGAVAADLPRARMQWTQADEPDECWDGDALVRRLARSFQRLSWSGRLGILVVGTQGSGKSATVDTIFGRNFMPATHVLNYMPADCEFAKPERRRIQEHRQASYAIWPHRLFERGVPVPLDQVCKMYVKVAGVSIRVTELPSMENHIEAAEPNGLVLFTKTGSYEEVLADVQNSLEDIVLLVERLDGFHRKRFQKLCRKLHRIYGEHVWARTVLVLTHGWSVPPDGLSFDEFVAQRSHTMQCCVRDISGDSSASIPTIVIENSQNCGQDSESGHPVLPNGTDFKERLLNTMEFTLAKHQGSEPIRACGVRRWWENYALGALVFFLITRL